MCRRVNTLRLFFFPLPEALSKNYFPGVFCVSVCVGVRFGVGGVMEVCVCVCVFELFLLLSTKSGHT